MERYDAILEQLKKAQGRGMETITNRLDFVVQSLEELIQEAKTSVQGALPDSAEDCLPVDEVEAALDAFREEAVAERQRAAELEARVGELKLAAESAPMGASIDLMRALDGARSQSELLKELLPAISEHAARAVVLVLRDGTATAWSGIGFTNGELLRAWQGDAADSSALATLLETSRPVLFSPEDDDLFSRWLTDEETPGEILLIPVVLRGKLMGTVYVDHLEGQPWNPDTAQTLVAQVCWLIDTLGFRPVATPTLASPIAIGQIVDTTEPESPPVEEETAPEEEAEPAEIDETEIEAEEKAEAVEEIEEPEEAEEEVVAVDEAEEPEETETIDEAVEEEKEEEPAESDEYVAAESDPSATMKVDVSGMGFTDTAPLPVDEIVTQAETETEDEPVIEGESFEPDEPVEAESEIEITGDDFEPDVPAEPDLDIAREDEFEPEAERTDAIVDEVPVEAEAPAAEPEEVPTAVQMPEVPPEDEEEPESSASHFLDEPPPVQPVQPPPEEPEEEISEDEAQQEEARRFARLLVSEIKLYNEEQVERGRETCDLYQRLQEDIDRSREMFEKRISEEIREKRDYFHDELVRILADGDPDALGM